MSSPMAPRSTQLNPPDLRHAHDAVVRQFRLGRLAAMGTMLVVALVLGFVVTAVEAGPVGLAWGVAVFVGFLALFAGLIALSASKERRHDGPAGPGPSSFGQVVTSAPGQQVWADVYAALAAEGFAPPRATDANTVAATRSLSMASYGETLTVRVEPQHDGRGLVTVWSRPAYPLQWLDYGRNRRYANAVLRAVPEAHDPAREPV